MTLIGTSTLAEMRTRRLLAGAVAVLTLAGVAVALRLSGEGSHPKPPCGAAGPPARVVPLIRGHKPGTIRWSVPVAPPCLDEASSAPQSSVVVGLDMTVVVNSGVVFAIDSDTGRVRWRRDVRDAGKGRLHNWYIGRARSGPVLVDDGQVQLTPPGAPWRYREVLTALDPQSGALVHRTAMPSSTDLYNVQLPRKDDMGESFGLEHSPGLDEMVLVGLGRHLSALDMVRGRTLWGRDLPAYDYWQVDGDTVYLAKRGSTTSRISLQTGRPLAPLVVPADVPGDLVITDVADGLALFSGHGGQALALRLQDSSVVWRIRPNSVPGDPAGKLDDGLDYVDPVAGRFYAARFDSHALAVYDVRTGHFLRRTPFDSRQDILRAARGATLLIEQSLGPRVLDQAGDRSYEARDVESGATRWRSPALPEWNWITNGGFSDRLIVGFACTRVVRPDGPPRCASFDAVAVNR
ncbi:MAG: hypothetical protein DLM59_06605 [Pseudonocardiales bacterium]|nr:MAG: hypothetical protein DLM59_06605 [Pseudonocardiales bacterium]